MLDFKDTTSGSWWEMLNVNRPLEKLHKAPLTSESKIAFQKQQNKTTPLLHLGKFDELSSISFALSPREIKLWINLKLASLILLSVNKKCIVAHTPKAVLNTFNGI